jgi:hypothetical protein
MENDHVIVHVKFAPDGTVVDIGERPQQLSPQQWFDTLCNHTAGGYQPLAGGRALYQLPRTELDALKSGAGKQVSK